MASSPASGDRTHGAFDEIEAHGWSLNSGRYLGVAGGDHEDFNVAERFGELTEAFRALQAEAQQLGDQITSSATLLLEQR